MLWRGWVCFQQWSLCHGDDWIELLSSESKMREKWKFHASVKVSHLRFRLYHLQLSEVELSCLLNVVLEFVEMVGGQNVLRGTEIHPVFSPSRARANSKMNFPSVTREQKCESTSKRFTHESSSGAQNYHNSWRCSIPSGRQVCIFNFHIV